MASMPPRLLLILLIAAILAACGSAEEELVATDATSAPAPPAASGAALRDGERELVVSLDPDGGEDYKLHIVRLDGSDLGRLTPEQSEITGSETYPAWSPDGQHLVFIGYTHEGFDLFTINADGTRLKKLTSSPGQYLDPSWSPDGTRILVNLRTTDESSIAVIDVTDGRLQRLAVPTRTAAPVQDLSPIWSPAGDRIAFLRFTWGPCKNQSPPSGSGNSSGSIACNADPITTLYTMNTNGSDLKSLLVTELAEDPRWSVDGAKIALTTFRTYKLDERVMLVMADGSGSTVLNAGSVSTSSPRWSSDGRQLSVVIVDAGGSEAAIVVTDTSGSGMRRVAQAHGWNEWSPDGSRMLVLRARVTRTGDATGRSDLHAIDVDSGTQQQVFEDAAIGANPSWRPVPAMPNAR